MLRRLALRDFVIVSQLEVEFGAGFTVLTGETGAGKSILVDALQLALGSRGDAAVVREGAARAEISAEFDGLPGAVTQWLDGAGIAIDDPLLVRRTLDAQGKSRAWINGSPATVTQLRELGELLVDIHGQHAWQSLTRAASVRDLLDAYGGIDTAPLRSAWEAWRAAAARLAEASERAADVERERERLQWQVAEVDKLAPGEHEWAELNAEHGRAAHAQAIIEAVQAALEHLSEGEGSAAGRADEAVGALEGVLAHDASLAGAIEVIRSAQAQIEDAAHSLHAALGQVEVDPDRLAELDARLSAWIGLARRFRRPPEALAETLVGWREELRALDAAADLDGLREQEALARKAGDAQARKVSAARKAAAPRLAQAVTAAMQQLGMTGGRFEVALTAFDELQSGGLESVEFLVAGHAGSTPRPMGKVASGGELSRIALAIAVTTSQLGGAGTLIFDEVDTGVGGAVAETVGRLMKRLGQDRQVLAVTHLPQVAACADAHHVVSKALAAGKTVSDVAAVAGEARVAEIARMLGGQQLSGASLAHAKEMLAAGEQPSGDGRKARARRS